ncbi:MAG: TCR/Tet family MFS transporter [Saprospiraceae bacterium]|jgi:MFS transporter, DHA1 family, tetracycline resistance protein|uniref:TCR/Tet family MFS transporter n=1 Tax=Candidatus Brachybacter algidus TaxID=2982024 RepID=UPI001B6849C1|nr:TCR/Tet family MFS transporter [Candidatus Brachybacter algidus]MBP7305555.1 TCR/Tet family MFS transporter [Saprospiraceae bacterium]MBK6374363.1 TCR/Tet family MFS transporter [Candidatus Brachybacter algidus]MBK6450688.1 TCR/Tet family MFS transporter [Candidatus Brachybacter algidus]MBK7604788.1 TCR/Tet family MFS transporter [Candidatus Brachybacter algidus]MBK8356319.1 TCR/Tet family MFS transporter [Candidatus Brachybacter algidus]
MAKKAAISFIFITLLIDVTGLGIIIPVLPKLIEELTGGSISDASAIGGWLTATYAALQFLFSPILGGLSDRYGRRPVLLISLFGFALDYLFLSYAPTISWLFVGRAIAGISGASFTTASAYIADISNDKNRAQNFGMIGAAFGLGFIIGPVIGGLLGSMGSRVPFMFAAGLSFLNWMYGYFVLPESLPADQRRKFDWKTTIPGRSLLKIRNYPAIGGLAISFFLISLASHAVQTNWSFFTIEKFGWSEKMIGISLGVVGLLVALVQGLLIRYTSPLLGNKKSIFFGLLFYSLGLFLFAFANQGWMMFVFLIPYCLGGIAGPALQSIISSSVHNNEQGELQGSLTSLISLTSILGPPLMTGLFAYFTRPSAPVHFSGVSFLLGGILMLLSAFCAYLALKTKGVSVI